MEHKYNNCVIEVLDPEHGKEVIKWWKSQGVDTKNFNGNASKRDNCNSRYYGLISGIFSNYMIEHIIPAHAIILTLPEDKAFPRWMWVNTDENEIACLRKRYVIYYNKQLIYPYLAIHEDDEKKYFNEENNIRTAEWKYAKEIEEEEDEEVTEVTMEQVCKKFGKTVKIIK